MSSTGSHSAADVIDFWFSEIDSALWFKKDTAFDAVIRERFGELLNSAAQCELFGWRSTASGRLAEVIVLDQFSRNVYRDSATSFANDPLALALAQEAVGAGADQELEQRQRGFLYMPYMHSESLAVHDVAVELFTRNGNESTLSYELKHREIIERFGRYPHRNAVLNRKSTAEELEFLKERSSSF